MNVRRIFSLPAVTLCMLAWLPVHGLAEFDHDWMRLVNLVTLFVILIGCLGAAGTSLSASPVRLWFPITWFLLTAAAYYGFGPLLYYFGTVETIGYSNAYSYVGDVELYRVNTLNLAGIASVLSVYLLLGKGRSASRPNQTLAHYQRDNLEHSLWRVSVIFASIGIPVRLLLVLPRALGLSDAVLPGGIEYFAVLSTLALAPLFILYRSNKAKYALPFYGLLFLEGGVAFATLSKLAILKVGIVLLLAAVLTGTRFKRLVIIGVIGALIYGIVLTPLIALSRIEYGAKGLTNLTDAQSALEGFARSGRNDAADLRPGVQGWWSRLNYVSAQSFAMTAYDQGRPGNSFELALYAFIPRILYPDKPLMTSGVDFNVIVTGNSYSQSAPGMFAEAYWNGGWPLTAFTYLFMGALYRAWEEYTKRRLRSLRLAYMPVMWMGIFAAIQQDSWFAAVTVGAISIAVAFHFLAVLIFEKKSRTLAAMRKILS